MSPLLSVADIRDWVVVIYGIAGIVFFVIGMVVMLVLGLAGRGLIRTLRTMMEESVTPALSSIKETADTIRGTSEFVGRTAVSPIVRTYGAFAGAKKGLSVLAGLSRRKPAK